MAEDQKDRTARAHDPYEFRKAKEAGEATARAAARDAAQDASKLDVSKGAGAFVPPKQLPGESLQAYAARSRKAREEYNAKKAGTAKVVDEKLKVKGIDQP